MLIVVLASAPVVVLATTVVVVAPALAPLGIPVTILIFSLPPANFRTPNVPRSVMFVGAVQSVAGVGEEGGADGRGIKVIVVEGMGEEGSVGDEEGRDEDEADVVDVNIVEGITGITIVNAGPAPIPGTPGKVRVITSFVLDIGVRISSEASTATVVYAVKVDVAGGPVTGTGMRSISVMVT